MGELCQAEIAIIGAGPAGMAAAIRLTQAGIRPVVFDMGNAPGGQIYRQLDVPVIGETLSGTDYYRGRDLLGDFSRADIDYRPRSQVWWGQCESDGVSLGVVDAAGVSRWHVKRMLLATGSMERSWPFPGWQLPGSMQAGAAQILFKEGGLVPEASPVLAGSGPLLYLLAWQYCRAGCAPQRILDTTPASRYRLPLRYLRGAWQGRHYLVKGARMMLALKRAGVPIHHGVEALEATGKHRVERVHYYWRGHWHHQDTSLVLTHFGVVPEPQLGRAIGIPYDWHEGQQCFLPERNTSLQARTRVWVAGDGGGIGGALNAEREGRLAALSMLTMPTNDVADLKRERRRLEQRRATDLAVRPLLEAMFRLPSHWLSEQPDTTLVCRCECVSLGELRRAIEQGAAGPNQLKAFTRCGMGPCQGRECGESVTRLLSTVQALPPQEIGYYQVRPPVQALSLGELAATATDA